MPLLGPNGRPLNEVPPENAEPVPDEEVAGVEDGPTGPIEVQTAFIIYLLPDGQWQVSDDLDIPLMPQRKPHGDDFTSACATTMRDVATRETANLLNQQANVIIPNVVQGVVQTQMAMAAKAKEQFEANAIAAKLEADKARRGGR
jgi:hypothetical protein